MSARSATVFDVSKGAFGDGYAAWSPEQLADLRGCFWGDIGGGSFHRLKSFLRVESSAQLGVSILDVNVLYHSTSR